MPDRPVLVVMLGGVAGGRIETLMRRALEASALDTIDAALASGRFECALLLADGEPEAPLPAGVTLDLDRDHGGATFHFGRRLAGAIERRRIERLLYVGAGGAPLLGDGEFAALAEGIAGDTPACVTNNFFSADLFAVAPASLFACLDPLPGADNAVPRRLSEERDVEVEELPRSLATQLNIDSPIDLAALALSRRAGPRLRQLLERWAPDTERMARAAMAFTDREAEMLLAGRVPWQHLALDAACRLRLLVEERGMGAAGRDADGSARSMLGQLIAAAGPAKFFGELLPQLCDAAFIDIRPALVQLGLRPSRADRFAADLGLTDEISDEGLRELVKAAVASPVPVVLGGHSLVAGALMLLHDWAWEQRDHALGL